MTRPLSCLLVAFCLAMVVSPLAAQTIYQWKDAKGVTHYSDSPPPKGGTRREVRTSEGTAATPPPKVAATGKVPKPEATPPKVAPPEATPPAAPQVVADSAKCALAQHNLESLQSNAPVGMDTDNDGNPDSELGAEDRTKYLGLAREAIKANCPGG